jgi:zinc protease
MCSALPQHSHGADRRRQTAVRRPARSSRWTPHRGAFGHRGIARKDDDFIAAYILNYIIGGGGFSSRLMEEVREKRGLAYSVRSNLFPYQHGAVFVGNVATQNERVGQSLDVIESELKRLAEEGPSAEELASAKSYLTGAYALRFETSSSIANQLLWIQIEDLGIDYVDRRNDLIEQVSLDDIKRVAKRLIDADRLITTIVGKPVDARPKKAPG